MFIILMSILLYLHSDANQTGPVMNIDPTPLMRPNFTWPIGLSVPKSVRKIA